MRVSRCNCFGIHQGFSIFWQFTAHSYATGAVVYTAWFLFFFIMEIWPYRLFSVLGNQTFCQLRYSYGLFRQISSLSRLHSGIPPEVRGDDSTYHDRGTFQALFPRLVDEVVATFCTPGTEDVVLRLKEVQYSFNWNSNVSTTFSIFRKLSTFPIWKPPYYVEKIPPLLTKS